MQQNPLVFGEVLFDCFPDGREVLGGAPFNVAWNLQAFGLDPIFISRVGDDQQGKDIRDTMHDWSMNTDFLQLDMSAPTGQVEISLTNGEPRFAILPNQAYDNISPEMPDVEGKPPFLYHGTLALRDDISRITLEKIKRDIPCPVFLDVNLRKPWWSRKFTLDLIADTTWLKLNDDECRALFPDIKDLEACAKMLLDKFSIETVFVTMGSKGAVAYSREQSPLSVQPKGSVQVVDTVGAGDGFSSILLLGLVNKWPLQKTLERAQEFASAVVGQRGATIKDIDFYRQFHTRWLKK